MEAKVILKDKRYKKVIDSKESFCVLLFIKTEEGFEVSQTFSSDGLMTGNIRSFLLNKKEEAKIVFNSCRLTKVQNGWEII